MPGAHSDPRTGGGVPGDTGGLVWDALENVLTESVRGEDKNETGKQRAGEKRRRQERIGV